MTGLPFDINRFVFDHGELICPKCHRAVIEWDRHHEAEFEVARRKPQAQWPLVVCSCGHDGKGTYRHTRVAPELRDDEELRELRTENNRLRGQLSGLRGHLEALLAHPERVHFVFRKGVEYVRADDVRSALAMETQ